MFMEAFRTDLDKSKRLPPLAFHGDALARLVPDAVDMKEDSASPALEKLLPPALGPKPAALIQGRKFYLSVRAKFVIALLFSLLWAAFSVYLSQPWTRDLATYVGYPLALTVIAGIAIIPGLMNAFMVGALMLDRRPAHAPLTVDGDSYLYKDALKNIVERFVNDPPHTAAVAGCILERNSRANWLAKAQEWDYFHGIACIKRIQSLFQETLVAQGAFSVYRKSVLQEAGGWPDCVGEDIVLTWAILKRGYRVGFCEDACAFTNVPATLGQFIRQRQRWSRGRQPAERQAGAGAAGWLYAYGSVRRAGLSVCLG